MQRQFNNNCNRCYGCTHYNSLYKRCIIGSDQNDCDDYEINDHFIDNDDLVDDE